MGTRGFVGFVVDGTEKIAYNHCDSYPDGLGLDVLRWAREIAGDDGTTSAELRMADAKRHAIALRVVTDDTPVTDEDIERFAPVTNRHVGEQRHRPDWYQLLRETQGNPGAILQAGTILDASAFPLDSLMAEWGYLVDLDAQTFEAYKGFQSDKHSAGRFADRPPYMPPHRTAVEWYPVAVVGSWPLDKLPSDEEFVAALCPDEDAT